MMLEGVHCCGARSSPYHLRLQISFFLIHGVSVFQATCEMRLALLWGRERLLYT